MLTPIEIQSKSFKGGIGYQKGEVESFLDTVSVDYEALFKENKEIKEKLNLLTNTLSHYRTIEKDLQTTIDLAKKASNQIINEAKLKATQIEEEAKNRAKEIILDATSEAKTDLESIEDNIKNLTGHQEAYILQCKEFAMTQIEFLDTELNKIKSGN